MRAINLTVAALSLVVLTAFFVAAEPAQTTNGFVCPVFNSDSVGEHNPNAVMIGGGDYTIVGPDVTVPIGATNGNGAGTPPGDHSAPGDTDYTAVWAGS